MAQSRREQVLRYADPNYEVPNNWTIESLTIIEAKRLARSASIARIACSVPRRLGNDVSVYTLAADKQLSKRVAYVYYSLWTRYVRSDHATLPLAECPVDLIPPRTWKSLYTIANANEEFKRVGSTIEWEPWWIELSPRLQARRMVLASLALERSELAWGYRMVVNLTDEFNWLNSKFDFYHSQQRRRIGA